MAYLILPKDLRKKSDNEILNTMHGTTFDSDDYKHCATILQLRLMQRAVYATWGLVIATTLLLVGTILNIVYH